MTELRFYAACLASYNSGRLHGAWIDASPDVEEMQEAINKMLRASPYPNVEVACPDCGDAPNPECATCHGRGKVSSAEEYAVHDYEGRWNLGEYPGLERIAKFLELVEKAEDRGIDAEDVQAILDHFGANYIDTAGDAIENNFHGAYDSLTEYAEQFVDECYDLKNVPDLIKYHIDYEGVGRDLELGGDVFTIDKHQGGGVLVFSSS